MHLPPSMRMGGTTEAGRRLVPMQGSEWQALRLEVPRCRSGRPSCHVVERGAAAHYRPAPAAGRHLKDSIGPGGPTFSPPVMPLMDLRRDRGLPPGSDATLSSGHVSADQELLLLTDGILSRENVLQGRRPSGLAG